MPEGNWGSADMVGIGLNRIDAVIGTSWRADTAISETIPRMKAIWETETVRLLFLSHIRPLFTEAKENEKISDSLTGKKDILKIIV